ncbi:MAG: hypothetical protein H7Y01_05715 [Ferruginibacter sp.]|nr:hypothetical protein [Chitinophagaceae bacterium]
MLRCLLVKCSLLLSVLTMANTIIVTNIKELDAANKKALPGDMIILQNGEWKDVTIRLNCNGTKEQPILFKAQTAGKVLITGHSQLQLGGSFIVADGFSFVSGFAGKEPVINFRIDSKQLANNCRVTNSSINDFNNPKRMDENNWVAFYGKNNRLDHCSFKDKKNMGVLLAVILDDDRSRENFHSIDHNYFGRRPPLASNGGEIIRVGVSQHCEFNSNTQITDNFFEHCDGETEIISIKSGSNLVKGNLFKESQGSVVLRHGNFNTVENNIFLGNGKEGTGGVRVINKGQWVVNNFFYQCRGVDFRSPLAIMNGIPNSPAHRYVQVTEAVIANNTFMECSPVSFGEGSDAERSLPPDNVLLINNVFYNTGDSAIYKVYDDTKGIRFTGNEVNTSFKNEMKNNIDEAFIRRLQHLLKNGSVTLPASQVKGAVRLPDSLGQASQKRLGHWLSTKPGFNDLQLLKKLETNAYTATGATWFPKYSPIVSKKNQQVNCATVAEVYAQLESKEPVRIRLTGKEYILQQPFTITKAVQFTGNGKTPLTIGTGNMLAVFVIAGNGHLSLENITIAGKNVQARHFISSDSMGSSNHYNITVNNCTIRDLTREKGCSTIFYAYKSMVADSIVFRNNNFSNNNCDGIMLWEEKDDKGYYNAEKIFIGHNNFTSQAGALLNIYRGGNDESTMGPLLFFSHNKITNCTTATNDALISLTGIQVTTIFTNNFSGSNRAGILVRYKDTVRARHRFDKNILINSGTLEKNKFVTETGNTIQ